MHTYLANLHKCFMQKKGLQQNRPWDKDSHQNWWLTDAVPPGVTVTL